MTYLVEWPGGRIITDHIWQESLSVLRVEMGPGWTWGIDMNWGVTVTEIPNKLDISLDVIMDANSYQWAAQAYVGEVMLMVIFTHADPGCVRAQSKYHAWNDGNLLEEWRLHDNDTYDGVDNSCFHAQFMEIVDRIEEVIQLIHLMGFTRNEEPEA